MRVTFSNVFVRIPDVFVENAIQKIEFYRFKLFCYTNEKESIQIEMK